MIVMDADLTAAEDVPCIDRPERGGVTAPEQTPAETELLAAALEGLYVARDSKALLVARSGAILSINSLAANLVGKRPEDMVGVISLEDLFDEPVRTGPSTEHQVRRWETGLQTAAGAVIPIEVVCEPLGKRFAGALVYAVRDLRERKEAAAESERKNRALEAREAELFLQNMRFDAAINNMPQGLAMFDRGERLLVCNSRFGELFGLAVEQVKAGAALNELVANCLVADKSGVAEPDKKRRMEPIDSIGGAVLICRNRLLSLARQPMADGGFVITTEDITDRESDKRRLEDYTAKLVASNQELQSFAYVASHDLQEPLRKIETFVDRILKRNADGLPADVKLPLERVQDASRRMRSLINDLLAYARLGKDNRPLEKVCLASTLRGVLSDLHVRIEETKAEILTSDLPTLDADPTQMRQLLQNLISNALKFSKPGVTPVIKIRAETRRLPGEADQIVLSIADNGIGFDNRFKEQIFKIFQRLHGRSEYEGTGVGLATCRKIVDYHKGSIDADGRPGEGATFIVVLPLASERAA